MKNKEISKELLLAELRKRNAELEASETDQWQAEKALRESEQKMNAMLESIGDHMSMMDRDLNILWANRTARKIFGDYIIGKKCYETYHGRKKPCEPYPCLTLKAFQDGNIHEHETQVKDKHGKMIHFHCTANVALRDKQGNPMAVLEISRDITEQKQAEEALKKAKEDAETANWAKGEFLATVSHELRTPLNGVMGMLQLVQGTALDDEQKEYVEAALSSGKGLLAVISDILDISRIEAGKFGIVEEGFDLSELLRTMTENFRLQAKEKNLHLHCDIDENAPDSLVGDCSRIRQILFNLVGNSLKFTEQGEVRIEASILTPKTGEKDFRLLFAISDTGIGIPEDMLEYIFEPFTQADGSRTRKYQGVGLGLGIVKRLITLMGGTIAVESKEGVGTTIRFTVKVKLPEPLSERRKEMSGLRQTDIMFSPLKVLVAEDNPVNRTLLVKLLEKLGHAAAAVEDGKEALAALGKESFDAVLMDVQMPVMDGVEATRAIRGSTSGNFDPEIPVIAVTAHAMKNDRETFLEAGMNDYVAKPVSMDKLARVLAGVMKKP
jgi:PAS domain S-box-containing protein